MAFASSVGRRLDTVVLQDSLDRAARNPMPDVLQRSLDALVAPDGFSFAKGTACPVEFSEDLVLLEEVWTADA